jgi:integrase
LTEDDRPQTGETSKAHEWTDAELESLFAASETIAAKPESRYDYTPLIRLTAALGLRIGEALGLRWEDFNKDEGTLRVERQWTRYSEYGPTKTKAGVRDIFLPDDVRKALIDLRMRSPFSQDSHPIFASLAGTPLGHRNVTRRGFEPVAELAELEVSFHDLRHAAASRLIASGIDDALVADQLGHEDSTITRKVYAHVYDRASKAKAVREALASAL